MSDRLGEYLTAKVEAEVERIRRERQLFMDIYGPATESPIELLMLAALGFMQTPIFYDGGYVRHGATVSRPIFYTPDLVKEPLSYFDSYPDDHEAVVVFMQAPVIGYRVDFLLLAQLAEAKGGPVRIVIECDGHDYHERTKEQAKRDRGMDRALQAAGFRVFRFTGSEIYRDPDRCVEEVRRHLDAVAHSDV